MTARATAALVPEIRMRHGIPRGALCLMILAFIAGHPLHVRADIAPDPEYGTSLAPWGPCGVRMLDEHVTLRLGPERVDVVARFTLVNGAEPARLRVGFPEAVKASTWSSDEAQPPEGALPRMIDFQASVDGVAQKAEPRYFQQDVGPFVRTGLAEEFRKREQAIEAAKTPEAKRRLRAELDAKRGDYGWWSSQGWLVWEMTFAPRQTRKVEVSYASPYLHGRASLQDARNFRYILTSGAFWDGTIGEAVVEVETVGGLVPANLIRLAPEGAVKTEKGARWVWKDLEPTFDIGIDVGHPDLAAASAAHRARGTELSQGSMEGDLEQAAYSWCMAYRCDVERKAWKEAALACRAVLAIQDRLDPTGQSERRNRNVECDGNPLLISAPARWEARLVDALENAGDPAAARAAATELLPALKRRLTPTLSENVRAGLQKAIDRFEGLAATPR
jgi:hypothetical protein